MVIICDNNSIKQANTGLFVVVGLILIMLCNKIDDIYFTQPDSLHTSQQITSPLVLNPFNLRHLRLRKKQTQQQIMKYQARINYLKTKDYQNFHRQYNKQRRNSMLEIIKKQHRQMRNLTLIHKNNQQHQINRINTERLDQRLKKNNLRVFNAQMVKREKIKNATKIHQQIQEAQILNQISHDNHDQKKRNSSQKIRKQVKNSIVKRRMDNLILKQYQNHEIKCQKLKIQEKLRGKLQVQIDNLMLKQKLAMERLESSLKFRQEMEMQYYELRGFPKSSRISKGEKVTQISEQKQTLFSKLDVERGDQRDQVVIKDSWVKKEQQIEEQTMIKLVTENMGECQERDQDDFQKQCSIFL